MFWAETIANEVERRYASLIQKGEPIVVRDEKTASGKVHVGSLRSASLHAIVADVLKSRGHKVKFLFEINDFDPMDGIPSYLDASVYEKYMGVPLCNIPSPEAGYENMAELYGQEYVKVLEGIGFGAEVYRASELYRSGRMNEMIRKALDRHAAVREIYFRISRSEKPEGWYPFNVICQNCGNLSATNITVWDGEEVEYTCSSDTIEWAKGCGHKGRISPFDGNGKFPWKLDWAAKFVAQGVHFEGGGKDHYTKGGSRQVAEAICREIFDSEPPYGVFNEFFLVGGKKMSSSKGNAATARDMADMLPVHILRLLLLKSPINRQIDFDPDGEAIPILFDAYDRIAEKTWSGIEDDDTVLFNFVHCPEDRTSIDKHYLPRFSQIAFFVQMPHMNVMEEVEKLKGAPLSENDVVEVELRSLYAKKWLEQYADDKFIFELQNTLPKVELSNEQISAINDLALAIEQRDTVDGQVLHELIHNIKESSKLDPKTFFSAIYLVFLGKDSGPKIGWFLSTLKKDFVINRLRLQS